MQDTLIEFETAVLAESAGYNIRSHDARYNKLGHLTVLEGINAPTQSLLCKWLRDKHNIHFLIQPMTFVGVVMYYDIYVHLGAAWDEPEKLTGKTYESALEEGIKAALTYIKSKN